MILHRDKKLMSQLIRATSERYNIILEFIEKDYWITHILQELSISQFADSAVFKGGTSLSKGYKLIFRFSEDVDLSLCHNDEQSGNSIKTLMRKIEKTITKELDESTIEGITSKGSRFRKSIFQYNTILGKEAAPQGKIIVEINSFVNPYPFVKLEIESFITSFLKEIEQEEIIEKYKLHPFALNVLDKRQTLLEKLVSLVRFSHQGIVGLTSKIRHFYDIHYLLQDEECREFVESGEFVAQFTTILEHDKMMFDDPIGWQDIPLNEIPLFADTERVWEKISGVYRSELSALAFAKIPSSEEILKSFKVLVYCVHN